MRTEIRTSRPKQTLRNVSYTGDPTSTYIAAYMAADPAALSAISTTDNIHY